LDLNNSTLYQYKPFISYTLMKLSLFLLAPQIKNIHYPACKDCIYFIPDKSIMFSKCSFFGEKNIITGEIKYDFADLSRDNEKKCGVNGTYYK